VVGAMIYSGAAVEFKAVLALSQGLGADILVNNVLYSIIKYSINSSS
jgi:hypothetical protein